MFSGKKMNALRELLPPNALKVVPPSVAYSQISAVFNASKSLRQQAVEAYQAHASILQLSPYKSCSGELSPGDRLLRAYFFSVQRASIALIDLRPSTLKLDGETVAWHPNGWCVQWDTDFSRGIGDMYRGYYRGDSELFEQALKSLGLSSAREQLLKHFGDDPSAVQFSSSKFVASFAAVFRRCAEMNIQLHANFIPLGIALATLYRSLEKFAGTYDVTAAFNAIDEAP